MRKISSFKIGTLFFASILALAGTGVAYAMWYDYLFIDGYVETGYIGAEWSIEDWGDSEPYDKDFSYIQPYIYDNYNDNDWLYLEIFNAYPCITYYVDFNIENTGSIPIHVYDIEWDYGMPIPGTVTITWQEGRTFPVQIHPDECIYGTLEIHLNNEAAKNSNYEFGGHLLYCQWNEAPTPPPPQNNPPNEPTDPTPTNGADYEDVYDVYLECTVSDPDGGTLSVSFYWGDDDTLIGTVLGVPSDSVASIYLPDYIDPDWLSHDTTYTWYAVANDGEFDTQGPTWNFKTCKAWDLNVDRKIDITDVLIIQGHIVGNGVVDPPGSEPWDINNDGWANPADLSIVISHLGEEY